MKVLEKGTGWSREANCTGDGNGSGGCGAKLLIEEADIFKTTSHSLDETTTYTTFECVDCKVWTDIQDVYVPMRIRDKAPHRVPSRPSTR